MKLLHIAGLHGTGSTILANLLGELDGFFSAGELAYLWQALERPDLCGCGRPVPECDLWATILGSVFSSPREAVAQLRPKPAWVNAARLPALVLQERLDDRDLARYRADLARVCRAITDVTGARIVVETSKHPPFGRVLARAPGIDASVVHLVRDPRASTHAWLRVTRSPLRPALVGATWTAWHAAIPRLWQGARYLPVRYEDFARAPREVVLGILELLDERVGALPFVDDHTVRLGQNHMAAGNRNRLRTGLLSIAARDEWRASLSPGRAAATLITAAPLLHRWGYRLHA